MAWLSWGRTNRELVQRLIGSGVIISDRVRDVMSLVDRGNYAPEYPYMDCPQPIGYGQTISAPHIHSEALELLRDKLVPGAQVLDVGCGSGYLVACMGHMVRGGGGHAYGIDFIQGLVKLTEENIRKADKELLDEGVVEVSTRSGWDGWPEKGPFDAIHVGAAAVTVPEKLVEQLKVGGLMVIPVGPEGGGQVLYLVKRTKDDGPIKDSFTAEEIVDVMYVPLVKHATHWGAAASRDTGDEDY